MHKDGFSQYFITASGPASDFYKDMFLHAGVNLADPGRIVNFIPIWEANWPKPSIHTAKRDMLLAKKWKGERLKKLWIIWPLTIVAFLGMLILAALAAHFTHFRPLAFYGGMWSSWFTIIVHLWLRDKFDL